MRIMRSMTVHPKMKRMGAAGNHHSPTGLGLRKSVATESARKQIAEKMM